ncbi:MAG: hypothetical protein DHS20C15_07090 [Planctomycetota bacterium]|nr:MAG: hypothetical protein DHS20C15_07090 [Planctomycetota bacterium]
MIRELITDADILSGRVPSPIVLRAGVCLTPAARDRAGARGMQIIEQGDAAPATTASAAPTRTPCTGACGGKCAGGCSNATCTGACGGNCAGGCGNATCTGACGGRCSGGCGTPSCGANASDTGLPAPAGAHGAAQPDQLADGLYLLRVDGGRVTSILPASGPGLMKGSHRA